MFALPEDALCKAGSVGRPNFFVERASQIRMAGRCPTGEIGEVLLKGPAACSGHFGAGEALDSAGRLHTGDLARRQCVVHFAAETVAVLQYDGATSISCWAS